MYTLAHLFSQEVKQEHEFRELARIKHQTPKEESKDVFSIWFVDGSKLLFNVSTNSVEVIYHVHTRRN